MSDHPIFAAPKPPQVTEPSLALDSSRLLDAVLSDCREGYRRLCQIQKQGVSRIWHHPRLSPQQAVDALGANAGRIYQAHATLTEVIVAVAALDGVEPDVLMPTHEFTMNADGTITVGERPYQP